MPLRIRASAISNVCFERLEIVVNGRVIADGSPSRGANWNAEIACEPAMPEGGWIAARCVGSAKSELDHRSPIFAHTSPIFVTVEGKPPYVVPAAVQSFRKELEQVRHWIETVGRFVHEKSKAHLLALCDEAMKALDKQ